MGVYLTYVANQKEDTTTGRHTDENFAREIEQLMSIGLYKLNQDGTLQTDANGAPIRNYTSSDIQGLAKVFTGYSWYATTPTNKTFLHYFNSFPAAAVTPMIPYPAFHSTAQKSFLGTTIPASATPDPAGDLKIALDTIFNNPNVGPFIGKQLIQRLVTSNPSRAYVSRVAAVFNDNGAGVRGDMAAVIKAILLDPEARDTAGAQSSPTFGKLREPVIRVTNWMRAFNATSSSGSWLVGRTSAPVNLDQTVMNAPSVFNFFRPGYSPPGTTLGDQGLVAPEFQIVDEVTVVGYLNTIQAAVGAGIGDIVQVAGHAQPDVRSTYGNEVALAADAGPLVDRVDLLLTYGQMSPTLRSRVLAAVNSIKIPAASAPQAQKDAALLHRAQLAAFLTLASPEYLTQR
jgi:uncharacterized protein (DUF1800 family)